MQFSLAWIRELCPTDAPVERISAALTARGLTVDAVEERGADHVLDLDIPANRPDCLGHRGVARELGAALGVDLAAPTPAPEGQGGETSDAFRVEIQAPEACRRFTARIVRGVQVLPSPASVVRRLEACGLRSINNVVDASNLVMLELGNPIHFFDLRKIADATIHVRLARDGDRLTTLDEVERRLDPRALLIADPRQPLALAGIMGGADSEIDEDTTEVLIEAACFEPASIRGTARRVGLHTDASYRFERGVDPEGVIHAQALAARLLIDMAEGRPDHGVIDHYPGKREAAALTLRLPQLERLLGYRPDPDQARDALAALGLAPEPGGDATLAVRVPSWRVDLEHEADLVEEVARHLGYDRIPVVLTEMRAERGADPERSLTERARDALAHAGFHEAYGYAMLSRGEDDPFLPEDAPAPLALDNPISESMQVLRRSVLPALVKAADFNLRRGVRDVRLFEVESVFLNDGKAPTGPGFPREPAHVGLAWSGAAAHPHWSLPGRDVDLYDVAGVIEATLEHLRPGLHTRRGRLEIAGFHPHRAVAWTLPDGERVAWCGQWHPRLAADLPQPLYLGVIDLDPLDAMVAGPAHYRAVPRLGAVSRDLAVVMKPETSYSEVLHALHTVDPPARVRMEAVDRYEGPPLEDGCSAVTVRVTLQPEERSLTDEQIETYREALVQALQRHLGLSIRG